MRSSTDGILEGQKKNVLLLEQVAVLGRDSIDVLGPDQQIPFVERLIKIRWQGLAIVNGFGVVRHSCYNCVSPV